MPSIQVVYRDEGRGSGPFYDHYCMQRATGCATEILLEPGWGISDLNNAIKQSTLALPLGDAIVDQPGKRRPPIAATNKPRGLLVIVGRSREIEKKRPTAHQQRSQFEQKMIRQALNYGQPVLAICAGAWQLYQAQGGKVKEAANHAYRGGMPRIITGGRIGYNKQVHRIQLSKGSMLAGAMGFPSHHAFIDLPVNSVHWQAPDPQKKPDNIDIVATAKPDVQLAPKSNTGNGQVMAVEADTTEAFEQKAGAPTLGIQWHPEAYNANDKASLHANRHLGLLKYMAKAGEAFDNKQRLLQEIKLYSNRIQCGFFKSSTMTRSMRVAKAELSPPKMTLP